MLSVHHLNISIKNHAGLTSVVNNLTLNIERGKSLALVGESGSGKTMTAMAIAQLLPSSAEVDLKSQIILGDQDLLTLSEIDLQKIRGRKIGVIFQEPMTALNPVMTVGKQIAEVIHRHFHYSRKEIKQRVLDLLADVGIKDPKACYYRYPHQLSGGMRQRVVIAIAIAGEPDVLIADEPTSALDVTLQIQILKLIKKIQAKRKMSLLFISHDLALVRQIADDVAVMKQGEIVEYESADTFYAHPQHAYSKKLLSVLPQYLVRLETPQKSTKPFLQVKDLKVYIPIQKGVFKRTVGYIKAVDGVTFEINAGKTLALIGESGSGKTTIGKAIVKLIDPYAGDISLKTLKSDHYRQSVQMIFQDPFSSLNPRMRVLDIITEGIESLAPIPNRLAREEFVKALLAQVGLSEEALYRYPHEFSGGQRQRISIARALALKPKLIICDEPTSALDVSVQADILKLLRRLQAEFAIAYLFITHNIALLPFIADEVAVLHEGKIVEKGNVNAVLEHPQHAYTKQLLSSVPVMEKGGDNKNANIAL